jgi:hypothetical protein
VFVAGHGWPLVLVLELEELLELLELDELDELEEAGCPPPPVLPLTSVVVPPQAPAHAAAEAAARARARR